MRTILIGQAAFAEKVLDGLRERGHAWHREDVDVLLRRDVLRPERSFAAEDPGGDRRVALRGDGIEGADLRPWQKALVAGLAVGSRKVSSTPQWHRQCVKVVRRNAHDPNGRRVLAGGSFAAF